VSGIGVLLSGRRVHVRLRRELKRPGMITVGVKLSGTPMQMGGSLVIFSSFRVLFSGHTLSRISAARDAYLCTVLS
jgi:hypothetical protein